MRGESATSELTFGQLLRRIRRASGLSLEELSECARVGVRTISDLERGKTARPYRQTVRSLAEALGLRGRQLDEFVRLSRQGREPIQEDRQPQAALSGVQAAADTVPPLPEAAAVPRQLPAAVSHFTGRTAELDALNSLLSDVADTRAVVVSAVAGTAGVGKTALAVHWAHQVAEWFPDGQLYVNLRGYDPHEPASVTDTLAGFLRALGVPREQIPHDVGDRARLYRTNLARRRVLVVLDNARDGEQVRPLLPGHRGCAAVITSRDALSGLVAIDGATRLNVDVLPLEDAVGLLRELVGSRVDDDPAAAAAMAGLCDRLPLALRIAAELAMTRSDSSLPELVAELAAAGLDSLEAGEERADVRAVFSWSFRNLPSQIAEAFALIGLHPGLDLDVYAAAVLTGTGTGQARRLLGRLRRASLIEASGASRYGMHDLLRDYARELAAASDTGGQRDQALTRLFDYYLHAAAAATDILHPAEKHLRPRLTAQEGIAPRLTEPGAARAWLDSERANLVAVAGYAAAHGWPRLAVELAATMFRYLDGGGFLTEAVTVHGYARHAARQTGDAAAEGRALANLAAAELRLGRDQEAARLFEQALPLSRQAGDRVGEARTLGNLGVLAFFQGRHEQAASYYEAAMDLQRKTGNQAGEATSLCNLAGAQIQLGKLEQAASHLQQALALSRHISDQDTEAFVLLNLGDVSLKLRRFTHAAPYLNQALDLSRRIGNRVSEAAALSGLGEIDLRQRRFQQAARHLRKALALSRDVGARSTETDALDLLGELSLATGDHGQARIHHAAALALACQADDIQLQARAHDRLARAHHADQDLEQARHHWQQALRIYSATGAPEADQVRARLAAAVGRRASGAD